MLAPPIHCPVLIPIVGGGESERGRKVLPSFGEGWAVGSGLSPDVWRDFRTLLCLEEAIFWKEM